MSFGFNPQRPRRVTNLPGAVGASISNVTSVGRRRSPLATPREALRREAVREALKHEAPKPEAPPPEAPPPEGGLQRLYEEAQWVYAVAAVPLCDAKGTEVAPAGARVLLVYPMHTDAVTGRVAMRLKAVDPVTAALTLTWVGVYDPEASPTHLASNFSLVA